MGTPQARRDQIVRWLQQDPILRIETLSERLNVSAMTIHRDLDALESAGLVEKVHGGVRLPRPVGALCHLCGGAVNPRTLFTLHTSADDRLDTCCAHCAALLLGRHPGAALTTRDFLYGRLLDAAQGVYVAESVVRLCCAPHALCFATWDDAERFQRGFGGQILSFQDWCSLVTRGEKHHHA